MKHSVRGGNLKRSRALLAESNWKVWMEEVALELSFENRLPLQHLWTEVRQKATLETRETTKTREKGRAFGELSRDSAYPEHSCVRSLGQGKSWAMRSVEGQTPRSVNFLLNYHTKKWHNLDSTLGATTLHRLLTIFHWTKHLLDADVPDTGLGAEDRGTSKTLSCPPPSWGSQ